MDENNYICLEIKRSKNIRDKRGIIFSIDAILSIMITITLISASFFYMSQIHTIKWSQPNYFLTSLDTINVLRIDGTLENAINTLSGEKIQEFMNYTYDNNMCGSMNISDSSENTLISVNKTGCTSYEEVYVYRGTIVNNKKIYLITLKLWYE